MTLTYLIVGVGFVIVALLSLPALHWAQGRANGGDGRAVPQAWVTNAGAVDRGVKAGQALQIEVVPATGATIEWRATNAGRILDSGSLSGPAGTGSFASIATRRAAPKTWLTITVAGISTPLRVWVR